MRFECRPEGEEFLRKAPVKLVNEVVLDASPEKVFEIFEDGESWPQWFDGIKHVEWTSSKPFGVGTTRTVTLDAMKVDEYFFIWEQNKRFAFYFTHTSIPFVKALCEDYVLTPTSDGKTRFTYTVAYEPVLLVKLLGPLARYALNKTFKGATESLQHFVKHY